MCKLFLKCSFSAVVDLCVSDVSARCNQATVAFFKIPRLHCLLLNYGGCVLQSYVFLAVFILPVWSEKVRESWACLSGMEEAQLLRRMKQNNSQRGREDGQTYRPQGNNNIIVEIEAKRKQREDCLGVWGLGGEGWYSCGDHVFPADRHRGL